MTPRPALPLRLTLFLAAIQCVANATWIAYVVYLPQLAAAAGIPRSAVVWILVADQAVFALSDLVVGRATDRALTVLRVIGPWLLAITVIAGIAFVALPAVADLRSPALFLACTLLWVIASSVLRAPALALVAKRTPKPALPLLGTLVVVGTALAAAAAPYLALLAQHVHPRVPFLVATATLVAVMVGLALTERRGALVVDTATPGASESSTSTPVRGGTVAAFFIAAALLAIGMQVHTNINTTPLYRQFASPDALPWLLPVFAVGTSLLAFAGGGMSKRWGAFAALGWAALSGALFCAAAAVVPGLIPLTATQFLAGGAWGAVNAVLVAHALSLGKPGREGQMAGRLSATLAVATMLRGGVVALGISSLPAAATVFIWLAPLCWVVAAIVLWRAGRRA
ncbi:MAG: hypothetical protein JNK68_08515 [Betaproteobacteria bacterium]|nr:hypothetical protein [Betaproteobacteria bacterium]